MKSNPNNYIFLFFLVFIQLVGCNSANIAVSNSDNATPTSTRIPIITPPPTSTPTPTKISGVFVFSNVFLSIEDIGNHTSSPISPVSQFPQGVPYITVHLDYSISEWTKLNWSILNESKEVVLSSFTSLKSSEESSMFMIDVRNLLQNGKYVLNLDHGNNNMLSTEFEIGWNSTLYYFGFGNVTGENGLLERLLNKFSIETEEITVIYPAMNINVGDKFVERWYLDGILVGENNWEWRYEGESNGIEISKLTNEFNFGAPFEPGNYTLFIYINGLMKQCGVFQISGTVENSYNGDHIVGVPNCEKLVKQIDLTAENNEDLDGHKLTGWDRYLPRTFSELSILTSKITSFAGDFDPILIIEFLPENHFPSKVLVKYHNQFRKTDPLKMIIIKQWSSAFFSQYTTEEIEILFSYEGLFSEGDNYFWLPLQFQHVDYMTDELTEGDMIEILIVYAGAYKDKGEVEFIYLLNTW